MGDTDEKVKTPEDRYVKHKHSTSTSTAQAQAQHKHKHSTSTSTAQAQAQHKHKHKETTDPLIYEDAIILIQIMRCTLWGQHEWRD
ncbi:hypothetical protein VI817_005807 [Penicillium citrinum]|nr:hypothetical protein VI817_005807 [Penicillium citrinum]